jgi:hypothetical protein
VDARSDRRYYARTRWLLVSLAALQRRHAAAPGEGTGKDAATDAKLREVAAELYRREFWSAGRHDIARDYVLLLDD